MQATGVGLALLPSVLRAFGGGFLWDPAGIRVYIRSLHCMWMTERIVCFVGMGAFSVSLLYNHIGRRGSKLYCQVHAEYLSPFFYTPLPPCEFSLPPILSCPPFYLIVVLSSILFYFLESPSSTARCRILPLFKFLFLSLAFLGFGTGKKCYYGAYQLLLRVAVKRSFLSC